MNKCDFDLLWAARRASRENDALLLQNTYNITLNTNIIS